MSSTTTTTSTLSLSIVFQFVTLFIFITATIDSNVTVVAQRIIEYDDTVPVASAPEPAAPTAMISSSADNENDGGSHFGNTHQNNHNVFNFDDDGQLIGSNNYNDSDRDNNATTTTNDVNIETNDTLVSSTTSPIINDSTNASPSSSPPPPPPTSSPPSRPSTKPPPPSAPTTTTSPPPPSTVPNKSICGTFANVSGLVHRNGRVIGGKEAYIEEFPWQISLQRFRLAFPLPIPDWAHTCGGAIVNEYWILTAAHCVDGLLNSIWPGQLRAVIGTDRWRFTLFQSKIQLLPISKIVIHPEWYSRKAQNDIALVRTSKSITFNDKARPICLPPSPEYEVSRETLATVAGYGYTTDNMVVNILPNRLQYAQIPLVSMKNCRSAYNRTRIPITDKMVCAGTTTYGRCTGALKGDSGSALITYDQNGRAIHTGIVSFSLPCRLTGAPDVYTRTASYLKWIEEVISRTY